MKYFSIITIALLSLAPTTLFSSEANHKKIQMLKKELSRISQKKDILEADYWNQKKAFINHQKNSAHKIKNKEKEYEQLVRQRNSAMENRLKKEAAISNLKQEKAKLELHISSINNAFEETLKELEQYVRYCLPFTSQNMLRKIEKIKQTIKASPQTFQHSSRLIINLIFELLKDSETCTLEYGPLLTGNSKLRKVWKLRLGNVFMAYLSTDFEHSGILLRSGKNGTLQWLDPLPSDKKGELKTAFSSLLALKRAKKEGLIQLPMDILFSKAVQRRYQQESGSLFDQISELFLKGGAVMYPLFILAMIALAIAAERIVVYHRNHANADRLMAEILPMLNKKKSSITIVQEKLAIEKGPLKRMVMELLRNLKTEREEIYSIMQEAILHEQPLLENRLSTLKIFAAIAPLLGLLGTVSGMISLFDVITVYGTKNPKLLAGGISEALITTQTGLIIAIPLVLIHRFLLNRSNHLISDMERYGLTIINKIWTKEKRQS